MKLRKNGAHPAVKSDMRFWILCVCFLLGMAAAYPARRSISADALASWAPTSRATPNWRMAARSSLCPCCPRRQPTCGIRCWRFCSGSVPPVWLIPLLCAAQGFFVLFRVLLRCSAGTGRCAAGAGSSGAAVSVCAAVYAVPGRCRFCPGVPRHAASAAPQTGAELADAAVLCVCASDRYGGGVRHCTKIFCAYFGAYRLKKERGEGI